VRKSHPLAQENNFLGCTNFRTRMDLAATLLSTCPYDTPYCFCIIAKSARLRNWSVFTTWSYPTCWMFGNQVDYRASKVASFTQRVLKPIFFADAAVLPAGPGTRSKTFPNTPSDPAPETTSIIKSTFSIFQAH